MSERANLNEERMKGMTGEEKMTGKFLYGEYFDFWPTHKVWLAVNHLPKIRGTDYAIWRRIREIPFEANFEIAGNESKDSSKKADKNLLLKLRKELPGILNWAIQGCLEWQKRGLAPAKAVIQATEKYR
jgi:putative DNA primase/helicase